MGQRDREERMTNDFAICDCTGLCNTSRLSGTHSRARLRIRCVRVCECLGGCVCLCALVGLSAGACTWYGCGRGCVCVSPCSPPDRIQMNPRPSLVHKLKLHATKAVFCLLRPNRLLCNAPTFYARDYTSTQLPSRPLHPRHRDGP